MCQQLQPVVSQVGHLKPLPQAYRQALASGINALSTFSASGLELGKEVVLPGPHKRRSNNRDDGTQATYHKSETRRLQRAYDCANSTSHRA